MTMGPIRLSSMAAGPAQARVRVPAESLTGSAMGASSGPMMAGQSAMIWAAAALRRWKAGRARRGITAPNSCGPRKAGAGLDSGAASPFVFAMPPSFRATEPSAQDLLDWYDRSRRTLPWRGTPDPYRIWVSEVMLQQTTVAAVGPRYARFLARFPDVAALARAEWAELAEEWAGLGYYARARNLHAAARAIVAGGIPATVEGWRALPGIGPYTAAAIGAIALGAPVVPVDGNVERVMARLYAVETPLPAARPALARLAAGFAEQPAMRARPGDFAQALFDLGATICTPRSPACAICPWQAPCRGRAAGLAATLPRKAPKAARTQLYGVHYALLDGAGRLLLHRRPESGLLGGMLSLPGTPWRAAPWTPAEASPHAPMPGVNWQPLPGEARHGFTHRDLTMTLWAGRTPQLPEGSESLPPEAAARALPTAMRKLLALLPPGFTAP